MQLTLKVRPPSRSSWPISHRNMKLRLNVQIIQLPSNYSSRWDINLNYNSGCRSPVDKSPNVEQMNGMEALEGFVIGLYSELFNAVISLINRYLVMSTRI